MWLGHSGVDVGSDPAPSLPLVATTITLEAIQNILWANGFAIERKYFLKFTLYMCSTSLRPRLYEIICN